VIRRALVLVAACGSSQAPAPLANEAPLPGVVADPNDEITFSRDDDCLDHTCPTYHAVIHRDGRVEWRGISNVRFVGNNAGLVEPRKLHELRVAFDLVKFDERNKDGSLGHSDEIVICADGWTFKIARVHDGKRHEVEHSYHCPRDKDLESLEQLLDDTVAAWK
jgi:hypothetical protein